MRCAQYNRYAGLLVAAHFGAMADRKLADLLERDDTGGARTVQSFGAEMDRLERSWREELGTDARYQPYLEGPGRQVNSRLLDTCDRISVYLCASLPAPFEVWAQNAAGDTEVIGFEMVDEHHLAGAAVAARGREVEPPVRRAPDSVHQLRLGGGLSGDAGARADGAVGLHPAALVGGWLTFAHPCLQYAFATDVPQ